MLLNGSGSNAKNVETQASLALAQLIYFNTKVKSSSVVKSRHSKDREPPIPLFVGLHVHKQTRSKKIVNTLYRMSIMLATAQGSFYGTGISIFQLPSHDHSGIVRDPKVIEDAPSRKFSLPGEYVNVPAVLCKTDQLSVPQLAFGDEAGGLLEAGRVDEEKWFRHGMQLLR